MNILAVDPGKHANAYARFNKGVLTRVEKTLHDDAIYFMQHGEDFFWNTTVVIEGQQVYKTTPNPASIIDVAHGAGRAMLIAEFFVSPHELVLPRIWKGQVPKKIHQERILSKLTNTELALLKPFNKGQLKDIIDAIGIGLWWLKKEGIRV